MFGREIGWNIRSRWLATGIVSVVRVYIDWGNLHSVADLECDDSDVSRKKGGSRNEEEGRLDI